MKPKPTSKKIKGLAKIHRSHFYPVSDNWFPNYPNDCVKVILAEKKKKDSTTFTIWVEGDDDFAMYYEIECVKGNFRPNEFPDEMTRHEMLLYLLDLVDNRLPPKLSQAWCKEHGFIRD